LTRVLTIVRLHGLKVEPGHGPYEASPKRDSSEVAQGSALMRGQAIVERMRERRSTARAVDVVSDLVGLLFDAFL
jgi:hypothetical protein